MPQRIAATAGDSGAGRRAAGSGGLAAAIAGTARHRLRCMGVRIGTSVSIAAAVAAVVVAGCGASATSQSSTPSIAGGAFAAATAGSAAATATPGHSIGQMQAMQVITVEVASDMPATAGVISLKATDPVRVGVGQRVSIDVQARIPPPPAETVTPHLLSPLATDPAVLGDTAPPLPGQYRILFTSERPGTTGIAYLPATCHLAPGAC